MLSKTIDRVHGNLRSSFPVSNELESIYFQGKTRSARTSDQWSHQDSPSECLA